jgi:hypothetical protein
VREIFRRYADDQESLTSITDMLNLAGVQSSWGKQWYPASVAHLLANVAYIGCSQYTLRARARGAEEGGRNEGSGERRIVTENAFEAVIARDVFDRAQKRLRSRTSRRTTRELAEELRERYERAGLLEAGMVQQLVSPANGRIARFRNGYAKALERAYAQDIDEARGAIRTILAAHFDLQDSEGGWFLNSLLHVGVRTAWPGARRGGIFWEFEFDGNENEGEVTVGVGFTPPPEVRVAAIFVMGPNLKKRNPVVRYRLLSVKRRSRYFLSEPPERFIRAIRMAMYFRNRRAEKEFLAAVAEMPLVSIPVLSRRLGWQVNAARVIYHRLAARGVRVPPLKLKPGRRLELVCRRCGEVKRVVPSDALLRKGDLCVTCLRLHRKEIVDLRVVTCPKCNKERLRSRSAIRRMKQGEQSPCRVCTFQDSQAHLIALRAERAPVERRKRELLRAMATCVLDLMQGKREFRRPALPKREPACLHWRDADTGARTRLTLRCSDEAIPVIERAMKDHALACLNTSSWLLTTSDGRHDVSWILTVLPRAL